MNPADVFQTAVESPQILPPYTASHETLKYRRRRRRLFAAIIGFCVFYGMAFAFVAPFAIMFFTIPLAFLGLLVVWALPDTRTAPTRSLALLFFAYMICLVGWPNYIAFAPPGMPWITMARLTGFPLAFILLICVSTSASFRTQLSDALKESRYISTMFVIFTILEFISVFFSNNKFMSIDKLVVAQVSWTAIFFASVYVFLTPGRIERMAGGLWLLAIFVGCIGIVEWRVQHILWAGHIPSFLKIEDPTVLTVLSGNHRGANGVYRVASTFVSPLSLGEYMALALPFVIQFAVGSYPRMLRAAAGVSSLFLLFVAFISGSRLGMMGCLLAFLFYGAVWSLLRWRSKRGDLIGPAVTLAYPFLFVGALASVFMIGRLRHIFWGSGVQSFSDQARQDQWSMGLPKILSNPLGHGIGMGSNTLGFSPFGFETIDSYYLSVVLEYGVIGFIVFYGMFLLAIYTCGLNVFKSKFDNREFNFFIPLGIALTNFFIVKSVFSEEGNHPLAFMMLGMVVALVYRASVERKGTSSPISTGG